MIGWGEGGRYDEVEKGPLRVIGEQGPWLGGGGAVC